MKLDSFRELLVKKSDGDSSLHDLIKLLREDVLADIVVESLEKMARASHKGDAANLAIRDFGLEMHPDIEPTMIHDAMGHHASRYKAALKHLKDNPKELEEFHTANKQVKDINDKLASATGDEKKQLTAQKKEVQKSIEGNMGSIANHHAGGLFKLMNMADKTQKHTDGKLEVSAPSPHAWERNIKSEKFDEESKPVKAGKKKVGQFVTDTKGWNYTGHRDNNFEFLSQKPHESYQGEAIKQDWNSAYPMEQIKVNGKHLHIDDNVPESDLRLKEGHHFDDHPIMEHYKGSHSSRTAEKDNAYRKSATEFMSNIPKEHLDRYDSIPKDHGTSMSAPAHEHEVALKGPGHGDFNEK